MEMNRLVSVGEREIGSVEWASDLLLDTSVPGAESRQPVKALPWERSREEEGLVSGFVLEVSQ